MNKRAPIAATVLLALACPAATAAYPDKPVRLVAPFVPGGPTDIVARVVAQRLGEALGQTVIVDNRGGAAGAIGCEIVARSAPDGYTIMIGSSGNLAVAPALFAKLPYDPAKDFQPITQTTAGPQIVVINANVPAKNFAELLALARAKPGGLNYGSGGAGTTTQLGPELLKSMAKIDIVHVPYKGVGLALPDMVAGKIQMVFYPPTFLQFVRDGKLRAITIAAPVRSTLLPDVPTTAEGGMPELLASSWHAIVAPAGVPAENIKKFHAALTTVMADKEVREKMGSVGADPIGNTPEKFAPFMRSEVEKWRKVIKTSGLTVD